MTIRYLPIYDQYFPDQNSSDSQTLASWKNFQSKDADFKASLSDRNPDFSVTTTAPGSWLDTAKRIVSFIVVNIFILPYGLYQLSRYIVQRVVMLPLFPAQSRIVRFLASGLRRENLDNYRQEMAQRLTSEGFIVRDVSLEKNGVRYSGILIGHKDTINNGNWALQATGNAEPVDYSAEDFAHIYHTSNHINPNPSKYNLLLINGPSVGRSEGQATVETIGDAQEVGISFLETALKAKRVVIAGRSLGGAAIGQAILKHDFKPEVKYLVINQMTFSKASEICGKFVKKFERFVNWLVKWSSCEMDTIAASRKLSEKGIKEIIVQCSNKSVEGIPHLEDFQTDGPIISDASLGYGLIKENLTKDKMFICLPWASHMTDRSIIAPQVEIAKLGQIAKLDQIPKNNSRGCSFWSWLWYSNNTTTTV